MAYEEEARIAWRCRRGLLELDLLLGEFFDKHYRHLSPHERAAFVRLLDLSDPMLLDVLLKGAEPPQDIGVANIVNTIRQTTEIRS